MKNHISVLLFFMFLFSVTVSAKIWVVDNNAGERARNFTTLQQAHDSSAVVNGDTLYIIGSPNSYGDVDLQKKLVLIGQGYFLNENNISNTHLGTSYVGTITCKTGSSGSSFLSLQGNIYISSNISNIRVMRCYFCVLTINNSCSNIIVLQNYNLTVTSGGYCSGITIQNNVINGLHLYSSCIISNNVFGITFSGYVSNSLVQNNILLAGTINGVDANFSYNLACQNSQGFPAGNGNINNAVFDDVFLGNSTSSPDGQYKLRPGSPAIGTGYGGVDMGIFAGANPYILSGLPPIPLVHSLLAPATATGNSMQVQIKVKSNN